jgi:phage terminase large subunit GpA-like protein
MTPRPGSEAQALYRRVAKAALALPPRVPYDRWATQNVIIPAEISGRPGPLDLDFAPFSREILRCYGDPRVRRVSYMKGSQIGGSLLLTIAVCADADLDPGPSMYLLPTSDSALEELRERKRPLIEASVKRRLKPGKREQTASVVRFDRMSVFFAWSNSNTQTRSRPIRYLTIDELDAEEFDERAIESAHQRVKAWPDHQIRETSSPGDPHRGIHAAFELGSRARYYVPCPHCGHFQTLVFERVRWEGGAAADRTRVKDEAVYVCASCGAAIDHAQKHAMLRAGRWVRHGQTVDRLGVVTDGPDYRWSDHQSFQLSSLYSPSMTWGEVAAKYLEFGARLTREFVTGYLGEPYQPDTRGVLADAARMALRRLDEPGGYRLERVCVCGGLGPGGTEPRDPQEAALSGLVLFAGIDVQADHLYFVVRAFGEKMLRSWLVDYGRLPAPAHDPERFAASIAAILRRRYAIEPGHPLHAAAGKVAPLMKIHLAGIDSGDRTTEVYEQCMRRPADLVPTKGYDDSRMAAPTAWSSLGTSQAAQNAAAQRGVAGGGGAVAKAADGLGAAGVQLLRINADYFKNLISDRLGDAVRRARAERESVRGGAGTGRRLSRAGGGAGGGVGEADQNSMGEAAARWFWPAEEEREGLALAALDPQGRPMIDPQSGEVVTEDHGEYIKQITAEHLERVQRPGKRARWCWRLRPGQSDNHLLDCEVIACAVASASGMETYTLAEHVGGR